MLDIRISIDAPLNFLARVELLNTVFKLLCLTQPTPGIEAGDRIEVCDYNTSSVSATLATLIIYQGHTAGSYLVLLRMSKYTVFGTQCPKGSERPPSPPPS